MKFLENPFYILGAGTKDNREELVRLAETKEGDPGLYQDALAFLLDPEKRLAAEMSWFPGVSPDKIAQIVAIAEGKNAGDVYHCFFNEIAKINYLLVILPQVAERVRTGAVLDELIVTIEEIDEYYAALSGEHALKIINVDRESAGFSPVENDERIAAVLYYMRQRIVRGIGKVLTEMPPFALDGVMRSLRERFGQKGPIIRDLTAAYGNSPPEQTRTVPVTPGAPSYVNVAPQKNGRSQDNAGAIIAAAIVGVFGIGIIYVMFVVFSVVFGMYAEDWEQGSTANTSAYESWHYDSAQDVPLSGYYWNFSGEPLLAPLDVAAPDGDFYYYVLLVDPVMEHEVGGVFLWPGETEEVDVPLGEYEIYYYCGTEWFGVDTLFGPSTVIEGMGGVMSFYDDGEYYMGNSLELPCPFLTI